MEKNSALFFEAKIDTEKDAKKFNCDFRELWVV